MKNDELDSSPELKAQTLAQQAVALPQLWQKFKQGEITESRFEQALIELSNTPNALAIKAPNEDLLWKQYALHVDLYKHYLEQIQKFSVFYYAVTGAILSFYFTRSDIPIVKYALLLPILMSLVFGILFGIGAYLLQITREEVSTIISKLNLDTYPEINVLAAFLVLSALLMIIVAGVLLWFFFPNLIPYSVGLVVLIIILLWWLFK